MKTSQAKDADTLRFTLCDDQDMGDMAADPCWWSSDVVKPTMKPPCVEPSGRSKSNAASEMDTVRRLTKSDSHQSEVPRPLFASARSQRGWLQRDPSPRLGIPNFAELRRFLPRQADIAAQPATARSAFTAPSVASALLAKHRPRCSEIGWSRSWMNPVISTLKLRSGNCVKWRPPTKDGPS